MSPTGRRGSKKGMERRYDPCAAADRRGDALQRTRPDIANCEYAVHARFPGPAGFVCLCAGQHETSSWGDAQ